MSAVILICPLILVYGIVTADTKTKQIGYNKTVKAVEITQKGDIILLGKRIDNKYLRWTAYPAFIGKQLAPKMFQAVIKIVLETDDLIIMLKQP